MARVAKKAQGVRERFWWFRGESVAALRAHLNGVGPECRLEVRIQGDDMTFTVIPESLGPTEAGGVINQSHVCPPICP